MIKLYAAAPAWNVPNVSPFVLKVDCYLRMVGLPYELVRFQFPEEVAQLPKGKIPYIEDQGQKIADSGFILEYLQTTYGDRLGEQRLNPREQAIALGLRRLMEEHLYWVICYARYMEDTIWEQYKHILFYVLFGRYGHSPSEVETVAAQARERIRSYLHGHGLGRHTKEEIYALGEADVTALSAYLEDRPYFLGEEPTSLDATAYGFLANILYVGYETPLEAHAKTLPNLWAYGDRMRQRYYSMGG
jgi:glutathione S-transferase